MQTQNGRVLEHLKQHGSIDAMTALSDLGVFRLAARINDLRNMGHEIISGRVTVRNRFGEECRVASYSMGENE